MSTQQLSLAPQLQPEQETGFQSSPVLSAQQPYGNSAAIDTMADSESKSANTTALKLLVRLAAECPDFANLLSRDGSSTTLSGEDLVNGQQDLAQALSAFHELADNPTQADQAIWLIYEVTCALEADDMQWALDLDAGAVVQIPRTSRLSPSSFRQMLEVTRRTLTANEAIRDNKTPSELPWGSDSDPVSRSTKDHFADTVDDALAARDQLRTAFGFDPSDRRFEAVEAMGSRLSDADIAAFTDAYLTAFFVHGANLAYEEFVERKPLGVFFGSSPGCDQLPDGRCIIDCQGFSAVGRLILGALRGTTNERGGDNLCLPFAIKDHQVVLILAGTEGSVVDNDRVHVLSLSGAELDHLHALHEGRFSGFPFWEEADDVRGAVDLAALPSLGPVVQDVWRRFGWSERPKVTWMDGLDVD